MHDAANGRLAAGLLQGGFQLASAGASLAGAVPSAKANAADNAIKSAGSAASKTAIAAQERLQTTANFWAGGAKGFEAAGVVTPAIAKFLSDRDDEAAKRAGTAADKMKRVAEGQDDNVKDADESLTRCLDFLKDWLAGKDAARAAAVHRA